MVIYNDHQLIAINKAPLIPVQKDLTKDENIWNLAEKYVKQPLHLFTRLDRPVSGICLFQKKKSKRSLPQLTLKQKTYYAVVSKKEIPKEGTLTHYITKNKKLKKAFTYDKPKGDAKKVELRYRITQELENYLVLQIDLLQGKFHQIRAQLSAHGTPIKGDVKYGSRRKNKDRSIMLHCSTIAFVHPTKNNQVVIHAPFPENDPLWNVVHQPNKLKSNDEQE